MKKLLAIAIALLFLTGCGANQQEMVPTEPTDSTEPIQEAAVVLYDPDSDVEKSTSGAVRAYPLGDGEYRTIASFTDKILVVSSEGDITALQGEDGQIAATVATELSENWEPDHLQIGSNRLAFYTNDGREVVILNEQFEMVSRIQVPQLLVGNPVICLESDEIFYCYGSEIRAIDMKSGVSRLVRSHNVISQALTGTYFQDSVIGCHIADSDNEERTIYFYGQTGEVIHTDTSAGELLSDGMNYFALRGEGEDRQILFGFGESDTMTLHPADEDVFHMLDMQGAVSYHADTKGLRVSFYDLNEGLRTAEVTLPGVGEPTAAVTDGSYIWILADQILYRWDISKSKIADETVYTGPLYTAENPDEEGLSVCRARADQMGVSHGIQIHIWKDAATKSDKNTFTQEFRVNAIERTLNALEPVLERFPEGFLETTGDIHVHLVGSIDNGRDAAQYWQNGDCHIVLTDKNVEQSFLWGLGWGLDARLIGNSRDLDNWEDLNPKSFAYTYDYETNAARENADDYLDPDSRCFVDQESMSFPTEDRARIFVYAMAEDAEEYFTSDRMQKKLRRICLGIREAYGLDESTEVFPWEQYLEKPLAKKVKE